MFGLLDTVIHVLKMHYIYTLMKQYFTLKITQLYIKEYLQDKAA